MKLYSNVTIIFCIWALAVSVIFYFGYVSLPHSGFFPNSHFVSSLANWDGGHYLGIADGGYDQIYQYAFFPLYPLLIGILGNIIHSNLFAGILISIGSAFLGVQLLFQLVSIEYGKKVAEKTVMALLFFPMSFYFLTVYSEGLFLFLTLATFLSIRKKRFFWATIFATLASATRLAGLGIVLALWAQTYFTVGINRRNWFILLAPLGFLTYCFYLYQMTGDPFYFVTAESHWQRSVGFPGMSFLNTLSDLLTPGFIIKGHFNTLMDFLFTIFGIGFILKAYKSLSLDYTIFGIFSLLLPLFSSTLSAIPRYLLVIFPIFILLATAKNRYANLLYQMLSLMLLSIFSVLFINGYWVS